MPEYTNAHVTIDTPFGPARFQRGDRGYDDALAYARKSEGDDHWHDLAGHYAELWNTMESSGQMIPPEELSKVEHELGESPWCLKKNETGRWQVTHSLDAHGAEPQHYDRAPKGHTKSKPLVIGGKSYRGGQFIPGKKMADMSPEERAQVDASRKERATRLASKGEVSHEGLEQELSGHAKEHALSAEEKKKAANSFRALTGHHKELSLHRLRELVDVTKKAMQKMPAAKQKELGKKLAAYHHMLGLAKERGITGKMPTAPKAEAAAQAEAKPAAEAPKQEAPKATPAPPKAVEPAAAQVPAKDYGSPVKNDAAVTLKHALSLKPWGHGPTNLDAISAINRATRELGEGEAQKIFDEAGMGERGPTRIKERSAQEQASLPKPPADYGVKKQPEVPAKAPAVAQETPRAPEVAREPAKAPEARETPKAPEAKGSVPDAMRGLVAASHDPGALQQAIAAMGPLEVHDTLQWAAAKNVAPEAWKDPELLADPRKRLAAVARAVAAKEGAKAPEKKPEAAKSPEVKREAPKETPKQEARPEDVQNHILEQAKDILGKSSSRMVPIPVLRQRIADKFGAEAAGHESFDPLLIQLMKGNGGRLVSVSDRRAHANGGQEITDEMYHAGIPGSNEQFYYVKLPQQEESKAAGQPPPAPKSAAQVTIQKPAPPKEKPATPTKPPAAQTPEKRKPGRPKTKVDLPPVSEEGRERVRKILATIASQQAPKKPEASASRPKIAPPELAAHYKSMGIHNPDQAWDHFQSDTTHGKVESDPVSEAVFKKTFAAAPSRAAQDYPGAAPKEAPRKKTPPREAPEEKELREGQHEDVKRMRKAFDALHDQVTREVGAEVFNKELDAINKMPPGKARTAAYEKTWEKLKPFLPKIKEELDKRWRAMFEKELASGKYNPESQKMLRERYKHRLSEGEKPEKSAIPAEYKVK